VGSNLYVGASGAIARLRDLEIVANNLANADTIGYKRDSAIFESALESALLAPGGEQTTGAPGRAFVSAGLVATDFTSGGVARTGAPLDVAINGPGFFEVMTPEGPRYTRAGSFAINPNREIATPEGFAVAGDAGPIQVESRQVEILATGEVVDDQGSVLGRLRVVEFDRLEELEKAGGSLFRAAAEAAPRAVDAPAFMARSIEHSNVVPVKELASLVILQRAFSIITKAMRADDGSTERLLQELLS
jgi:flagellar basal body rod protein FlgG